jgi:hypothetical protein
MRHGHVFHPNPFLGTKFYEGFHIFVELVD